MGCPSSLPLPAAGVPIDLLQRRPDLRSAQLRASAADNRQGAAIANWFPRVDVRAGIGVATGEIGGLFDAGNIVRSVLGALTQTLLDGGRRAAEIERRTGMVFERLAVYGQTFVTALAEVDNALVLEEQRLANIEGLEEQVEIAEATLRRARNRYREGLTDFPNALTALTSLHGVEPSLRTARRQLVSHRIELVRALGGSWTERLTPPERLEAREMRGE